MRIISIVVICIFALLVGCVSNPINRVTADNYLEQCADAESRGDLKLAEEACRRSLINTEWGNLGEEQKSEKLYNYARIKRRLGKHSEAKSLLLKSLGIEQSRSNKTNIKIGRRLVELSVNYAALGQWNKGASALNRMLPVAKQFTGKERQFTIFVLNKYGEHYKNAGNLKKGNMFINNALAI